MVLAITSRTETDQIGSEKKLVDVRERAARSVFQLVSSFLPVDPAGNTEHEVLFIPSSWDGRLKK